MRFAVLPVALLAALLASAWPNTAGPTKPIFLYTKAVQYAPDAWETGGERFPQGAKIFVRERNGEHELVPDFAQSADPAISSDGKRVLFSGKRGPGDAWEIWEVSLDDKSVRRMINCSSGCVHPLYLPEERIVFARKNQEKFIIEATVASSSGTVRLTYSPGSSLPLDVLRDGRILFQAGYPLGESSTTAELYTVYSDGSGVEAYRCDHGSNRYAGRQVSSGDIVLVSGPQMARFTSPLAHEVKVNAPAGEYAGEIAELEDGSWLLPWRNNPKQPYGLVRWKPDASKLDPVVSSGDANLLQPTLLSARPTPNRHPSGLHDWSYANLLCLNAYTSKVRFDPDSLASVRVYTRDASGRPKLLGEAPVEKDGSFYVRTPGDQPLQIELRDRTGKIVKKEDGWFWLRRGEQRICVGCHAGPETSPENAVPMVLLRSTIPADMTGTTAQAAGGGH